MKSHIDAEFRAAFRALPPEVREPARKAYRLFKTNPRHPSLYFKKLRPNQPIYSVRVSREYCALGRLIGDEIF